MLPWHQCVHPRHGWSLSGEESASDDNEVLSLKEICALQLMVSHQMLELAASELPGELLPILMSAALQTRQIKPIQTLIGNWRDTTLSLSKLFPLNKGVKQWQRYSDPQYVRHAHAMGIHYTTCFVHGFLSRCSKRDSYKLRLLDLRGYPTSDLTTSYVATHCLLHYNEVKKNQLVDLIQEAKEAQKITSEDVERFGDLEKIITTLQEASYAVLLDCVIDSGPTFEKLCKAITVSNFAHSPFCLIVNKLDLVNCIGEQAVLALEILNPQHLTGLGISANSLGNYQMVEVLTKLSSFVNLTALDVSSNNLDFSFDADLCDSTANMIGALPKLERLDLSNNLVGPRLRRILCKDTKGLKYLNLSGCCLRETDLIYLANSSEQLNSLRELDMSHNAQFAGITSDTLFSLFRAFSRAAKPDGRGVSRGLRTLDLQSCGLYDPEKAAKLIEVVATIRSLEFFNFAFNLNSPTAALELLPKLTECRSLQALCVSIPRASQTQTVADEFDFLYEEDEETQQNESLIRAAFKFDLLEHLIYRRRELGFETYAVEVFEERNFIFFYTFSGTQKQRSNP